MGRSPYGMIGSVAEWIKAGELEPVQDMVEGFENMPQALARLYDGSNVGVQCCRVRGEPDGRPSDWAEAITGATDS